MASASTSFEASEDECERGLGAIVGYYQDWKMRAADRKIETAMRHFTAPPFKPWANSLKPYAKMAVFGRAISSIRPVMTLIESRFRTPLENERAKDALDVLEELYQPGSPQVADVESRLLHDYPQMGSFAAASTAMLFGKYGNQKTVPGLLHLISRLQQQKHPSVGDIHALDVALIEIADREGLSPQARAYLRGMPVEDLLQALRQADISDGSRLHLILPPVLESGARTAN